MPEKDKPRVIDAELTGQALYHLRMSCILRSQAWDHEDKIEELLECDVDGVEEIAAALSTPTTGEIGDPNEFASDIDTDWLSTAVGDSEEEVAAGEVQFEFTEEPEPYLPPVDHKQRHVELHRALDELVADYWTHNKDKSPSNTTFMELMTWSHEQTLNPTPDDQH